MWACDDRLLCVDRWVAGWYKVRDGWRVDRQGPRAGWTAPGPRGVLPFPPGSDRWCTGERPSADHSGAAWLGPSGPDRHPGKPTSWAITEQVRTVSANRLTGRGPLYRLNVEQIAEVRTVLAQMIDF